MDSPQEQSAEASLTPTAPRIFRPSRAAPSDVVRPTRAEINLEALRHNLRVVQRQAGEAQVFGVLKADGYGHGAKAVARTLERAKIDGICVALLEEAIELREAGIRIPIVVMGGYYGRAWAEVSRYRLTPVIHDIEQISELAEEVRFGDAESMEVHLKIDTGMARLGVRLEELHSVVQTLARCPEVRVSGLMTHFACADAGPKDAILDQLGLFAEAEATLRHAGHTPSVRHAANSAALFRQKDAALDMVRPGIALFGVAPGLEAEAQLRPAMRVRTEVVALRQLRQGQSVGYGATWKAQRPSTIATVPLGYADGLSRALSNRGHMLIRGRRAPVVGVVSMDMTMLDVTDIEGVSLRDECVALGAQKGVLGEDTITAAEVAHHMGSIPWEVLTNVSRRVPRFYREP
ncbi:MAG: alanine racemase [Polyangiaceae bacterium]|nr:alanine racemase [Polyangiaceae bacterium]